MPEQNNARNRGLHLDGDPDPSQWDEVATVADKPGRDPVLSTTFAERAAARESQQPVDVEVEPEVEVDGKRIGDASNKKVGDADSKRKR